MCMIVVHVYVFFFVFVSRAVRPPWNLRPAGVGVDVRCFRFVWGFCTRNGGNAPQDDVSLCNGRYPV